MRQASGGWVTVRPVVGVLAVLLVGCAGAGRGVGDAPAEQPPFAGLGVELRIKAPLGILRDPQYVYVARTDFWAGLDDSRLVRSRRCSDSRCYFRIPEPGTWAVVAVAHDATFDHIERFHSGHVTFLSRRDAERTATVLARDAFAFMGRYTIDQSIGFGDADDLQRRCQVAVGGGEHAFTRVLRIASQQLRYWHRGTIIEEARDAAAADGFLKHAEGDLPGRRLAPLQPVEPARGPALPPLPQAQPDPVAP